ncbi:MAG: DUF262 domain-containing protein [Terracidiphilus sp.]|jgi:hypothetical protein
MAEQTQWWEDGSTEEEEDGSTTLIREYDISSSPNDFNVMTIMSFLESGSVKIPAFQRNYVWDIKKASKLIESIIIGLPIPQIFLFERSKNNFLVIDGQQRLMSIYYFMKGRFPLKEKRVQLRQIFDEHGEMPGTILHDKAYFSDFDLRFGDEPRNPNPLTGKNYMTLDDLAEQFRLRTIRNVIIKQNLPTNDDSSMYEIFSRLNSGGVNLGSQELRACLYHSSFYRMLYRINANPLWRKFTGQPEADLHMKDIEVILRGFALLFEGKTFKPSMSKFLNNASKKFQEFPDDVVKYLEGLFNSFLAACSDLPDKAFFGNSGVFTISIFDAVFPAVCRKPLESKSIVEGKIDAGKLGALKADAEFLAASQSRTAGQGNVRMRLSRAEELLG